MRAAALLTTFACFGLAGCTLAFPLDDLQDGDGAGAAGPSTGPGNPTTSNMTASGGAGQGGASTTSAGGAGGGAGGATYEETILADGPRLYFRMSDAATEPNLGTDQTIASGTQMGPHALAPTIVAGGDASTTYDDPTKDLNQAGEDDTGHLEVPGLPTFFGAAQPFSLELWARLPTENVVENADLVRADGAAGGLRVQLKARFTMTGTDAISFGFRDAGSTFDDYVSYCNFDDWTDATRRHFVLVYDPSVSHKLAVYVNGVRCDTLPGPMGGQVTGAYAFPPVTTALSVGNGWSGAVDEVALYGSALDLQTICAHYEAGGGTCN